MATCHGKDFSKCVLDLCIWYLQVFVQNHRNCILVKILGLWPQGIFESNLIGHFFSLQKILPVVATGTLLGPRHALARARDTLALAACKPWKPAYRGCLGLGYMPCPWLRAREASLAMVAILP